MLRVALLCTILTGTPALASAFQVSPVRLETSPTSPSALLTVRNSGTEEVRLQIQPNSWDQGSDGQPSLTPTQDVFVFPTLLVLKPGEVRQVRVGTQLRPAHRERTFRIIVEQMPSLKPRERPGIDVLTRMSIPLFVAPTKLEPRAQVSAPRLHAGKVNFALENHGTFRLFAREAHVRFQDGSGKTVAESTQKGWYVLAGGAREFQIDLPPQACNDEGVRAFVRVDTDVGTFASEPALVRGRCKR